MSKVPEGLRQPDVTRRVRDHLREIADADQPSYVKAKYVASALDEATPKMVSNAFRVIEDDDSCVIVSRWSAERTTPSVWEVRLDAE